MYILVIYCFDGYILFFEIVLPYINCIYFSYSFRLLTDRKDYEHVKLIFESLSMQQAEVAFDHGKKKCTIKGLKVHKTRKLKNKLKT